MKLLLCLVLCALAVGLHASDDWGLPDETTLVDGAPPVPKMPGIEESEVGTEDIDDDDDDDEKDEGYENDDDDDDEDEDGDEGNRQRLSRQRLSRQRQSRQRKSWQRQSRQRLSLVRGYPGEGRRPQQGMKCMMEFEECRNSSNGTCEKMLQCHQEKSKCWKTIKDNKREAFAGDDEDQRPEPTRPCKCKTQFEECLKTAEGCENQLTCYKNKMTCYKEKREQGRHHGHRRKHHRPHHHRHHHRRLPEYLKKCMIEKVKCMAMADFNCTRVLACKYKFVACIEKHHPTLPPTSMPSNETEIEGLERRNMTKCKVMFKKCEKAAGDSCPKKLWCFKKAKFCYKRNHPRPIFENMRDKAKRAWEDKKPKMKEYMWKVKQAVKKRVEKAWKWFG
ncbi:uncharacterized protein LOC5516389 isoform X1 [Nematostella vectensis]|uniref:uncharacterized protein LOC5516389 isoform X1 n=1 Tax=Nematostella vectensis TaxID=45351 RepID=UPI0020773D76|nr:uncharacterized protein LOC5516389 isoform X1 [Nematostella vectensis]